uniref:OK/SW-CL.14 n=1 Tax=Homo sapiens TaxID=9606 RepID=Q8NI76_HUMAN|nr:OK/SW-CL.14 [Homo sapiens]
MHFHNICLLERSIISEKYQVFIKFLGMADSQNMLVSLQYSSRRANQGRAGMRSDICVTKSIFLISL